MKVPKNLELPSRCPLCHEEVLVTRIACKGCGSEIRGSFSIEGLAALPSEYQRFIMVFLRQRGNIKGVEKELGISYPTINKMLETINRLTDEAASEAPALSRKEVLDAIDAGEMSVQDATRILKKER